MSSNAIGVTRKNGGHYIQYLSWSIEGGHVTDRLTQNRTLSCLPELGFELLTVLHLVAYRADILHGNRWKSRLVSFLKALSASSSASSDLSFSLTPTAVGKTVQS